MHHRFEPHGSQQKQNLDTFMQELSKWIEEHDAWMREVTDWDHQLRHLMVLVHDLDNSLPYERHLLVNHYDVIKSHRHLLERHAGTLNHHKDNLPNWNERGSLDLVAQNDVSQNHSNQRYQHMRVRDSHLAIRFRHQQAMDKVNDLLKEFCKKIG